MYAQYVDALCRTAFGTTLREDCDLSEPDVNAAHVMLAEGDNLAKLLYAFAWMHMPIVISAGDCAIWTVLFGPVNCMLLESASHC